jgi:hypothetical protein
MHRSVALSQDFQRKKTFFQFVWPRINEFINSSSIKTRAAQFEKNPVFAAPAAKL